MPNEVCIFIIALVTDLWQFPFLCRSQSVKMGVNTLTAEWTTSAQTHWHRHSSLLCYGHLAPAMSCPREVSPPMLSAAMPWGRTFTKTSCGSWRWVGRTWRIPRPRRKRRTPVASPSAPWSSWICCMRKSKEWCAKQGGCSSNPWWPCRRRRSWSWSQGGSGSSTGSHSKVNHHVAPLAWQQQLFSLHLTNFLCMLVFISRFRRIRNSCLTLHHLPTP